ncbi:hypothetical protein RRG08_045097 [Elysia crispata]|uniref:Uncharacterized protein n=1 Tax=Elysia crispata TaxID=231223 RepID=A0AAE0YUP3_9GAST|nr:hypothetical protein RRG08_045097 [Elysia crispata]
MRLSHRPEPCGQALGSLDRVRAVGQGFLVFLKLHLFTEDDQTPCPEDVLINFDYGHVASNITTYSADEGIIKHLSRNNYRTRTLQYLAVDCPI